ncbi:MAG: transposase, partial [Armatimonadetes bacterium]|nr:transposase [Armatimonadota bacterium]
MRDNGEIMARLPRGRRPSDRWRNFDNAWKLALERLLLACLQFFFPQIAALLDEARPIEFLEQELKRISRRTQQRKGAVDLLARAWLRSGQEHWLLLHLEVQSQKEPEFPERMCLYSRRIRERHGRLATSLAILADDVRDWRPNRYREEAPGTVHEFEFTMVKVLDYADQLEELQ